MKICTMVLRTAAAAAVLVPIQAQAQRISITPLAGAYIPASNFYELREGAQDARVEKEATFGLGLALELGSVRGMLAYATGATVNDRGVDQASGPIGDGSVLVATASMVFRPLPRLLGLRPYVMAGGGLKRASYSFDEAGGGVDPGATFDDELTDPTAHLGVGADLMVGPLGVVLEANDFITLRDGFGPHDGFVLLGLRVAL
ncbi:MAG: hypothetical protein WEA24_10635 [Gemmatimonadota bacterium]